MILERVELHRVYPFLMDINLSKRNKINGLELSHIVIVIILAFYFNHHNIMKENAFHKKTRGKQLNSIFLSS